MCCLFGVCCAMCNLWHIVSLSLMCIVFGLLLFATDCWSLLVDCCCALVTVCCLLCVVVVRCALCAADRYVVSFVDGCC